MHQGEATKAKQLYAQLIADGHDSYDLRSRLAQLASGEGDLAQVEKQLCAAKKLDPERSYPYQELHAIYKKVNKPAQALAELEHYAFLEQMELAPIKELILEYGKLGAWAKVKTYAEMGIYIAPHDPDVLAGLARGALETGDPARALFAYDTMLLLRPAPRRPALVHLGRARALLALGKQAEARAALGLAAKTEPEHVEVIELRARLR
jgi:predicted Zn-dependent protease